MNPLFRVFLASLGLAALLAALPVAAQSIYKWTDASGVVHYSDQPPPESAGAERLNIRSLGRPRSATGQQEAAAEATDQPESDACTTARRNLIVFENNDEIRMDLDGDGTAELLSPAQRDAELERTRELIALLCR